MLTESLLRDNAYERLTTWTLLSRDVLIIPQNLLIILWEFPQNQANYSPKTKPIILDNNFTLSLVETPFAGWTDEHNEQI